MSKALREIEFEAIALSRRKQEVWEELKNMIASTDKCLQATGHLPLYWNTVEELIVSMGKINFAEQQLKMIIRQITQLQKPRERKEKDDLDSYIEDRDKREPGLKAAVEKATEKAMARRAKAQ